MADDTATAEDAPITFSIKASNDAKFTLTLPLSTTVSELKEKLASSEYADTAVERQRLIYSGRVLKDNDTLETYKIKDGHTIHLVKSAASNQQQRAGAATERASTSTPPGNTPSPAAAGSAGIPGVPTNLAAGTGNDPLAGLTGGRYAGFTGLPSAGLFGPDGGMGPPPDPDTVLSMLENPQMQSMLNEALNNPDMINMMIRQNPMLRDMPGAREMLQSEEFRRSMTDPATIRQMAQVQRALRGSGLGGGLLGGGLGGGGGSTGGGAFPAPGVTDTTPDENRDSQNNGGANATGAPPASNPFGLGAGNPFAALFPSAGTGQTGASQPESGATAGNTGGPPPLYRSLLPALLAGQNGQGGQGDFNPYSPEAMDSLRQVLAAHQGEGGTANPFASLLGLPGLGGSAAQDNRPPEERYAEQLRQLNDMGFFEFERNIEALRRSGGSVQGAIEYLLSQT
ncbi:ubiquitin domain-containing protein DSK2 [Aspergillus stella-maris]|uniref:ubiquitin domain-containing protein DSK2 n=1 Tax=Aspergillus stella-maris TaxID=1810926 RepID=UPI003CCD8E7D